MMTMPFVLMIAVLGQAPPSPEGPEEPAARLDFMRESLDSMREALAGFDVHSADERATIYRFQPDPIMNWTNPEGGGFGAIFLWLDAEDRPGVLAKVYRTGEGYWGQGFLALAKRPLIMKSRSGSGPDWTPTRDGLEFRPVPEAPRPAATPVLRSLQMRDLTREFAAEANFRGRGWSALRLLPKPLSRYGKPGPDLIDGALFSFVLATDPLALLVLEARPGRDGPEWQYAFARLAAFAVKGSWKGREVWNLPPSAGRARDPNQAFHTRAMRRER